MIRKEVTREGPELQVSIPLPAHFYIARILRRAWRRIRLRAWWVFWMLTNPLRVLWHRWRCEAGVHRWVHVNSSGVGLCGDCDRFFWTKNGKMVDEINVESLGGRGVRAVRRQVRKGLV